MQTLRNVMLVNFKKLIFSALFIIGLMVFLDNYLVLAVLGASMHPTLIEGDWVLCDKKDKDFKLHDIIVYKVGSINDKCFHTESTNKSEIYNGLDGCTSHRIVGIGKDHVYTKGDNNFNLDDPVPKEDIICKIKMVGFFHGSR